MAKIKDVYPLETGDIANEYEEEVEGRHSSIRLDPKMERKIVLKNDFYEEKEEEGDQNPPPAPAADATAIFHHPTLQTLLNDPTYPTIRKSSHDITIGYDHFTVDQVLSQILPKKDLTEIPSSFEVVGHLAHITLREEYYPYKYIIGRVILDKNKGIKVVVNKTGTIQNEFRTFPMEILADDRQQSYKNSKKKSTRSNHNNDDDDDDHAGQDGTMNLLVEVREDGCRFQLDFEKVYWNSRLQYEHKRIVQLIGGKSHASKNKIVVADACAGIGPFAIPLTSQFDHVEVYANDLNPESYKYLKCKCNSKI
jgi:tRNA (guanine37-N1)-methyltransferase